MSAKVIPIGRRRVDRIDGEDTGDNAAAALQVVEEIERTMHMLLPNTVEATIGRLEESIRAFEARATDLEASHLAKACCYKWLLRASDCVHALRDRRPALASVIQFPRPKRKAERAGAKRGKR